ncbi:head GIN domain-containing protein [Xanthocytophaga flava]|nr:head GIN domain-containing protein [Xanthocytophaga flavus]MDJ1469922.1 head GIN domain-containing protein [Xanthocytophaga flavus]
MKTLHLIVLFICSSVGFAYAQNSLLGVKGEGPVITQNRSTQAFDAIDVSNDADVYITQGSSPSIRVEGQQNILDVLKTEVEGKRLKIHYGRINVRKHEPVKVYVTTAMLTSVHISGSSSVKSESVWDLRHEDFESKISGSGNMQLKIREADQVKSSISGSGNMTLGGNCNALDVHISGSGNANAFDLVAGNVDASITGSGNCRVNVQESLKVHTSGSGDVRYKGNPKSINKRSTGSGGVTKES